MPTPLIDAKLEAKASKLEKKIFGMKDRLAKLLRSAKPRRVQDYRFVTSDGKPLRLSQAFGKHKDLIVVHNMGTFCPYCTLWADEYNGAAAHLENRAAFLVVSSDEPAKQKAFRRSRGWTFRMASVKGTTFNHDMGFEPKPGEHWPGFTTFRKGKGGAVERVGRRFFGPGDDFCGVWHFFEMLHGGTGEWQPRFRY